MTSERIEWRKVQAFLTWQSEDGEIRAHVKHRQSLQIATLWKKGQGDWYWSVSMGQQYETGFCFTLQEAVAAGERAIQDFLTSEALRRRKEKEREINQELDQFIKTR